MKRTILRWAAYAAVLVAAVVGVAYTTRGANLPTAAAAGHNHGAARRATVLGR